MTEKRALPSHRSEFSTVDYWTEFYANRDAFEWYGDFHTLCEMIVKHIKKENEILMAGCGNSELSAHMFDQGWRRIVNVDFNPGIIKMMRSRHERSRPQMKWYCMDLSNLDLDPQSFDVVVDKGTLDAIFSHEENESQAAAYLHEMHRILRPGGRFLIVSLLQPFILRFLLRWFTEQSGYILGFTRLPSNSANSTAKNGLRAPNPTSKYVVFSVVAMKLKFPTPTAFRMCWTTTSSPQPLPSSADDVLRSVMELQALREIALPPANRTKGGDRSLEFFDTSSNHLRFVLHVVDLPRPPSARPMAVFLVPLGKERVWSYGTGDGRMDLAQTLDFDRLIVALPVRGQYYAGKEASMAELNAPLMDIARAFRPGIDVNAIPFLSESVCGNEGKVEQILPLVGKVFVSAVIGSDGFLYKRLVFKANPNIIQSEARFRPRASHLSLLGQEDLSPGEGGSTSTSCSTLSSMSDGGGTSAGNKKKKRKGARKGPVPREADGIQERIEAELMLPAEEQELDWNYINDTHHALMLLSLGFLSPSRLPRASILVLGLGGGCLPRFLADHFQQVSVDVVEIDAGMLALAKRHFCFPESSDIIQVTIQDGRDFIHSSARAGRRWDVVMFDLDSKDWTKGLSCPPADFLEENFLVETRNCLEEGGLLVINLACRDSRIKQRTFQTLLSVFPVPPLYFNLRDGVIGIGSYINQVLYCRNSSGPLESAEMTDAFEQLELLLKNATTGAPKEEIDFQNLGRTLDRMSPVSVSCVEGNS